MSEPAARAAGVWLPRVITPALTTASMAGSRAAFQGVLPCSDGCGSSARQGLGMMMAYFTGQGVLGLRS